LTLVGRADDGRKRQDHRENLVHRALVEDHDVEPGLGEIGRNVGLGSREAEHEIRLQLEDSIDLRREKGGNARLFAPRARRPHGVARDADDAPLLAQEVEGLGGFLGEADDALGMARAHAGTIDHVFILKPPSPGCVEARLVKLAVLWVRCTASGCWNSRPSAPGLLPACCLPTWAPTCWCSIA